MKDEWFTAFASMRQRYQAEFLRRAPEHIARLDWSAAQIAARQLEGLRALLAVARERSPFHARRLRGIDPDRFQLEELPRLPVMTKAELMDDFDDALTDRRVTRALCERALAATTDEPQPLFDAYFCLSSGGSSGRRDDADQTQQGLVGRGDDAYDAGRFRRGQVEVGPGDRVGGAVHLGHLVGPARVPDPPVDGGVDDVSEREPCRGQVLRTACRNPR